MPSTSKSPKTAMVSRASSARPRRVAAASMPGMQSGSSQEASSEGARKARASSASAWPRATSTRATRGGTPSSAASTRSAAASAGSTDQRRLSARPAMLAALPHRGTAGSAPGEARRGRVHSVCHVCSLVPGRLAPRLLIALDCTRAAGRQPDVPADGRRVLRNLPQIRRGEKNALKTAPFTKKWRFQVLLARRILRICRRERRHLRRSSPFLCAIWPPS